MDDQRKQSEIDLIFVEDTENMAEARTQSQLNVKCQSLRELTLIFKVLVWAKCFHMLSSEQEKKKLFDVRKPPDSETFVVALG